MSKFVHLTRLVPASQCASLLGQLLRPKQNERGFTVFELIVTMFIIIILSALAAPAMQEMGIRSVVKANTNDLVTALNLARAEAVKRGRDVSVIAVASDWNDGWTIQAAGVAEALVSHDPIKQDYLVLGAPSGGGAADRVIFTSTGTLRTAMGYDFSICRPDFSPGNEESRRIIVTASGSIRSRRDTSSSPAGACS